MKQKIKEIIKELKEPYDGYDDDNHNCSMGYNLAMEIVIDMLTEIIESEENENEKNN